MYYVPIFYLNVTFVISFITKLQYVKFPWVASTSTNCSLGPLFIKQQGALGCIHE